MYPIINITSYYFILIIGYIRLFFNNLDKTFQIIYKFDNNQYNKKKSKNS